MKLAIHGGKKTRGKPMPSRMAFGPEEKKEMSKMLKYYHSKEEDPKYSGLWEQKFCKAFSKFMGGGYADAVATGTGAIYVAMKALDIPKGSDVIISPITCSGNFSCITEQGLNPILVDSEKDSYNTSLNKIKERITKNTKLIQITHAGGEPVKDIKDIARYAKKKNISLLEDCSQSVGAHINGKLVGNFGDIAAFSTMYRKNLAANSSAGVIFTKNFNIFKKVLAHGDRGKLLWKKNLDFRDPKFSLFPALNWNTDEFTCSIGLANLRRLNKTNNKRKIFLKKLINSMNENNIKSCSYLNFHNGYSPFYFPMKYNFEFLKISKRTFCEALIKEGIPLGINYGCVVADWIWAKKYFLKNYKTKNAIKIRDKCFHLYLNENYKNSEVKDIVKALKKIENFYIHKN